MNAIMKDKPAPGCVLAEVDVPKPGPTDVLLKIRAWSICGTDAHIYKWDAWAQGRIKPPMIFGHEFCGEVVEAGKDVTHVSVGDLVSGETHIACFSCFQCKTGNAHICEKLKILGVDTNGTYADYAVIPQTNAILVDKSIPADVATAQEPLGNAVHTVFAQEIAGKSVSVFGCGPIGLCAIQLAKSAGASAVYGIDINDYRLDMAKKMGATRVINSAKEDVVKELKGETPNNRGIDVFLEIAGHPQALRDGLASMRAGGEAAILGVFPDEVSLNISNAIVFKQATIRGINGRRMYDTWYKASALLKSGAVDLSKIITHKFKGLEQFEEGMNTMISGKSGKIVITPK